MGCVRRLLMLVLLLLLLAAGWRYRDRIASWVRASIDGQSAPAGSGRADASSLATAQAKLAALGRPGAAAVTLDAGEMASLIREALDPVARGQLDSLRVQLGEGRIGLTGQLRTAQLPRDLLGPFSAALRAREPVQAQGPLRFIRAGMAEWVVERGSIRDIPIPPEAIPRLMGRLQGDQSRRALTFGVPLYVSAIRVTPAGVTLSAGGPP